MTFSSEQRTMITTLIATGTFSGFFGSGDSTAKINRRHLDIYSPLAFTPLTRNRRRESADLLKLGVHFFASL